ncbi:hypothetical protein D3C81_919840 [compost metagenome]
MECIAQHRRIEDPDMPADHPAAPELLDTADGGALQRRVRPGEIDDVADDVVAHADQIGARHIHAHVVHRLAGVVQEAQLVAPPAHGEIVEHDIGIAVA